MNNNDVVENLHNLQRRLLNYIEKEQSLEENYQNLELFFKDLKIQDNIYLLSIFLHLISEIANNHERSPTFFGKIEKIILFLKKPIQKQFTNSQLYNYFKKNKRILLFLFEEKLITIDKDIAEDITNSNFLYFQPEIQQFYNSFADKQLYEPEIQQFNKYYTGKQLNVPDDFYIKRKIGENDDPICKIILDDSIDEFITYFNKNFYLSNDVLERSIYETNCFLVEKQQNKKNISLIEYAVFFGSIQIFKYLQMNEAIINDDIWFFAIHGNHPEIISILEENSITFDINNCLNEAIKCHHNDIANYIIQNYLPNEKKTNLDTFIKGLKYYNFDFIDKFFVSPDFFEKFCEYDYPIFVDYLLKTIYFDVNHTKYGDEISLYFLIVFQFIYIQAPALFIAVENENIEIVKILLLNEYLDINASYIS